MTTIKKITIINKGLWSKTREMAGFNTEQKRSVLIYLLLREARDWSQSAAIRKLEEKIHDKALKEFKSVAKMNECLSEVAHRYFKKHGCAFIEKGH